MDGLEGWPTKLLQIVGIGGSWQLGRELCYSVVLIIMIYWILR